MGKQECDEKEVMADFMVRTTKQLLGTGMLMVIDSGFFVLE